MLTTPKLSKIVAAAAIAAGIALTGCVAHAHAPVRQVNHSHGRVVVVKKGHVHSHRCGHYRHEGRWYFVKGHVHGRRCGHAHVRGVWIRRS